MHRIMFICYGNICRSPMAEFMMKDLVRRKGTEKDFYIRSSATGTEGLNLHVHYGTRKILDRLNITDYHEKVGVQLKKSDYDKYDLFIGMDRQNIVDIIDIFGGDPQNKVKSMMSFAGKNADVADPWWTRDFEATYRDIKEGTEALYDYLYKK